MASVTHPFTVTLHSSFQDEGRIYLVMDFIAGGPFSNYLKIQNQLPEDSCRFYIAQIILAIDHLHSYGVMHRDLKPDNVLIERNGYLRIIDFGLARQNVKGNNLERTNTVCGTISYRSPEMIKGEHGSATDWWSIGVMFYEMLTGMLPFEVIDDNREAQHKSILNGKLIIPKFVSANARSLIQGLLCRDETRRLGYDGIAKIKSHPFFTGFDWAKLLSQEINAPYLPIIRSETDTSRFDPNLTRGKPKFSQICFDLTPDEQDLFKDFDCVVIHENDGHNVIL